MQVQEFDTLNAQYNVIQYNTYYDLKITTVKSKLQIQMNVTSPY